jgi:hypothetical protein
MSPADRRSAARVRAALEDALVRDPRFLCDARLLASLHGELRRRLGEAEAARALLQAGFFHGLRDAGSARFDAPPRSRASDAPAACATPLVPLRFASTPDAHGPALRGHWPRQGEAEAIRMTRGRQAAPACLVSAGYTSGWLSGLGDGDVVALERRCAAAGHARCEFEARDAAAWRALGDPAAAALLDALPFALLREAVGLEQPAPVPPPEGAFDPESPAIHVWGPVMVVPYAGEETAVAVEAVSRDPGASAVSVVVVDLAGAIVDDGFAAVALERLLERIHDWGAEAVITGLSPLSERVVAGLAGEPIVVPKDLRAAIATAFQIAEAQRRAL